MNVFSVKRAVLAALISVTVGTFAFPLMTVAQQSEPSNRSPLKLTPPKALQPPDPDKPTAGDQKPTSSPAPPGSEIRRSSVAPFSPVTGDDDFASRPSRFLAHLERGFRRHLGSGRRRLRRRDVGRHQSRFGRCLVAASSRRYVVVGRPRPDATSVAVGIDGAGWRIGTGQSGRPSRAAVGGYGRFGGCQCAPKINTGPRPDRGFDADRGRCPFPSANDNARACALAASQIGRHPTPYWQKAFIFCQAMAGEHDKASLGVALLRETGDVDSAFFVFIDALDGGVPATIDSLPRPTPLHLTMARAAKARLPADIIGTDRPGVLRTIAISPNAAVELRLDAAERAEAVGALAVDTLRQLYTGITFSDQALANPLSKAEAESGPLSRALLYRTALIQTVPTAQAEAASRALALAREGGRYASTARIFLPVLQGIHPSAELMWFAPEAVRALLVGGDLEALKAWLGFLRGNALFDEDARKLLTEVRPLVHLAGAADNDTWSDDHLREWWDGRDGGDEARRQAALLFTLFESLGETVSEDLWAALLDGPQRVTVAMPRAALWQRLPAATEAGRVGETVLLALLALGDGGPAAAHPIIMRRVLFSLRNVGFEVEARAMAVEAMLAVGL